MTAAGSTALAGLNIAQERNTPMAKTPNTPPEAVVDDAENVEPAATTPDTPPEAVVDDAENVVAEANDAAPDTIKVRLKMSPDVETELIGGEAERLDLERQGFLVTEGDDTEGSK